MLTNVAIYLVSIQAILWLMFWRCCTPQAPWLASADGAASNIRPTLLAAIVVCALAFSAIDWPWIFFVLSSAAFLSALVRRIHRGDLRLAQVTDADLECARDAYVSRVLWMLHREQLQASQARMLLLRVASSPVEFFRRLPESHAIAICREYSALVSKGKTRVEALETIEKRFVSRGAAPIGVGHETRWLRPYLLRRVRAICSDISVPDDFLLLLTSHYSEAQPEAAIRIADANFNLHPMAHPIPIGVIESVEYSVETMTEADRLYRCGARLRAIDTIDAALSSVDSWVLQPAQRENLMKMRLGMSRQDGNQ
jgi:hypothetical protein